MARLSLVAALAGLTALGLYNKWVAHGRALFASKTSGPEPVLQALRPFALRALTALDDQTLNPSAPAMIIDYRRTNEDLGLQARIDNLARGQNFSLYIGNTWVGTLRMNTLGQAEIAFANTNWPKGLPRELRPGTPARVVGPNGQTVLESTLHPL